MRNLNTGRPFRESRRRWRPARLTTRDSRRSLRQACPGRGSGKLRPTAVKLKDRIAIITGATSGLGEAAARLFAEEGAKVVVSGRDEARGRKVAEAVAKAGGTAIFVRADVTRAADCERLVAEALRAFGGRLDILFNNAGVYYAHNAVDCTEEEWDATVDSSLKGAWLMSKYALPAMIAQGRGVIIHQASGWGIQGGDLAVAYCAAKGGVVVMTKAMAIDHGKQGIRVNCLAPATSIRRCWKSMRKTAGSLTPIT